MKTSTLVSLTIGLAGLSGMLAVALIIWTLVRTAPTAPALIPVDGATTIALSSGTIRYQSVGTGEDAIVFLHGFNSQLSIWNEAWSRLGGCGRAIRLDIAGYGGSSWENGGYTLPEQSARVIEFLDALKLKRVTLVGVSMGASLSAWIAAHHPERINAVVLMAPSGYPGSLQYGGRFGKLLRPGLLNAIATVITKTSLYRRLFPQSRALQALSVTSSYGNAWAKALGQIRARTWLVWSRGDTGVPFEYADDVARAIPMSQLMPLDESVGHDIPGNKPALVAKLACAAFAGADPNHLKNEMTLMGEL